MVLGLSRGDADKYNAEFQLYDRMIPVYRENGIQAALLENSLFYGRDCTEEDLLKALKRFHVAHLILPEQAVCRFDAPHQKRAAVVGRALVRYVAEGGGLFLEPQSVRYRGDEDELYWNAVLKPLGATILHEGIFDKTRAFQGQTLGLETFWTTRNVLQHPVTKGVSSLCLPLHNYGTFPGTTAMQYSRDWQILVRGEKEAKSYRSIAMGENAIDLNTEGTYPEAPPLLAVRQLGKGRIVCYPISQLFTGLNHRNPLWADIVECNGGRAAGRPSDSMKMQMNAYHWLAEPARAMVGFGRYLWEPYRPIEHPGKVNMEATFAAASVPGIRGIFGLHSAYSDGSGTVADYVKAARTAGLSFLVFADPLEKLTKEHLMKLKADCAAASKRGDFYACPGIEFTDSIGNRWTFWGEEVVWPDASFDDDGKHYVQWDGQRVHHYGQYITACKYCGSGLLDYRTLGQNGAHRENLWWFYHYLPFVYEKDRLVADNEAEYLFGLRDMRWAAVASFTRVRSPGDVALAARACFTGMKDLPSAKAALNSYCAATGVAGQAGQYVSQGPIVASWEASNSMMETNWGFTRGGQRVVLHFAVQSDLGIAEVKVLDADRGPIRRFLGHGAKELSRDFELVHDQQHYLVLEVIDMAGRKAVSYYQWLFCYKSGLFRCGDNLNILGPTGMCWHPDRNQFFNAAKYFRNGSDYCLAGWDTASPSLGVPTPDAYLGEMFNLKEAGGLYPELSRLGMMTGRLMEVGVNSYNIQIATMRMTKLSEPWSSKQRPTPAFSTVPRDGTDLEYCDQKHTLFAPMERVDMFIAWNHRRDREGRKDYKGGILWHEGEIRFKKACTLQGSVPLPLCIDQCPTDLGKNVGTNFVVTDADSSTRTALIHEEKKPISIQGHIRPGGYAALMTTPVGYHGLLAPADMHFVYEATLSCPRSTLTVGLGHDGEKVKAGQTLNYRFGVGTFADEVAGNMLLEHTLKAMNLGGGHSGYPVEMKTGQLEDAVFFFTCRAAKSEASFVLGPQDLMIELPIRVRGLENNGCAALWSTKHPWFRFIPVDMDGTAWFQEDIDRKNEMWVGNPFVCDNKEVKITLVVDGQAESKLPFVELHNPTDKEVPTKIHSPAGTPLFGGSTATVHIPAGDSVRWEIKGKKLEPQTKKEGK